MEAWVRDKVARLNLDASVYVDYTLGLLQDEDFDLSERVETVISVFSSAADGLVAPSILASTLNASKMAQDVKNLFQVQEEQFKDAEALEIAEKKLRDLHIREQQLQEAEEAAIREKQKTADRLKNMTRQELAAREHLISEYGFTLMSEFDEEGNVVKIKDKDKSVEEVGPGNTNKHRVQQAQQAMREKMKTEYEKKVKYEKELLAKDKARKDKAKKRTVKKEKQRGCG
uniref:Coiled-coil domain-containing protein 43 n=1 Tax=Hyaloperonospora arabidopsidis (strain Emoy2) TaxID=559515 RepID=M4B2N3_HYAAE